MSCVVLNGVREFPNNLSYILVDSFTSTAPRKIRGLGSRSLLGRESTVSIRVHIQSDIEMAIFSEWWITELEYGTLDFTIEIPFFGINKVWTAKISSEISESIISGEVREITLELKILNHLDVAMQGTDYTPIVGISPFPSSISFLVISGFAASTPKKSLGLGGRKILEQDLRVTIKAMIETEENAKVFLEWWVLQLNCGLENFTINFPYNGITKGWNVIASNDLKEVLIHENLREVTITLKILDDIQVAIDENILCGGC